MILKETILTTSDNSGALRAKCVHIYQNTNSQLGNFVKVVLHKFDSRKKLQKKKKYFGLVIATAQQKKRQHGQVIKFSENRILLFADKQKFLGTRISGPVCRELKKKLPLQQSNKLGSTGNGFI